MDRKLRHVYVLVESGSQRSYIHKQGLAEVLSDATLGGETSESKRFQMVRSLIIPKMEALTLPKICNALGPVKLNLMDNPHLPS